MPNDDSFFFKFKMVERWPRFEIMSEVLNSEGLMYIFGQIQDSRMAVTLKTFY